jgi:plasmid maintenance system antidote protein VapI
MKVRRAGRCIREKFFGKSFWSRWVSPLTGWRWRLHVSPVKEIVREKRGITPEMAARMAKYFGNSRQFWLNLQDAFPVHQVRRKYSKGSKAIKPLARAAAR